MIAAAILVGAVVGVAFLAACLAWAPVAHQSGRTLPLDFRAATAFFNLGHVLADAEGGMYCPCNLLPLCRQCNADMGKETLTDVLIPVYDNRECWDGKFMADPGTVTAKPESNRGRARWNVPATV